MSRPEEVVHAESGEIVATSDAYRNVTISQGRDLVVVGRDELDDLIDALVDLRCRTLGEKGATP